MSSFRVSYDIVYGGYAVYCVDGFMYISEACGCWLLGISGQSEVVSCSSLFGGHRYMEVFEFIYWQYPHGALGIIATSERQWFGMYREYDQLVREVRAGRLGGSPAERLRRFREGL